jgi:voltage-gated potassium channel Kch
VIARSSSRDVADRMRAFAAQEVVNPLDRFGDHLRILLRSPAAYQLMVWLTSAPGTPLPERPVPPPRGRWVVAGHGRFGAELTADLEAEGLEVTRVHVSGGIVRAGEGDSAAVVEAGDVDDAVAFVAATQNDTTNLWLVEAARRANPDAFVVALQNRRANAMLFEAVGVDFGMVPAEVIAHEVLARIASPVLMRFLPRVPREGEAWSARMLDRLVERCGTGAPDLWRLQLDAATAPALVDRLATEGVVLADLLRDPASRVEPLAAVPLALLRADGTRVMAPEDDVVLHTDDQLLIAGRTRARSSLDLTLTEEATAAYVLEDRFAPSSWVWRRIARRSSRRRDVERVR